MTPVKVKCLTDAEKSSIVAMYNQATPLKDLAKMYLVSPRTIGRVLEERGLATPVPRLKGEAHLAMKILKEFQVSVYDLEIILANHALENAR